MSTYSIARYLHSRPTPPFLLGGWISREGDRTYLGDSRARFELKTAEALQHGDLVSVNVIQIDQNSIECDKIRRYSQDTDGSSKLHGPLAADFARFVRTIRDFFVQRGFTELFTPTLVTCPGLEPSLEPFAVEVTRGREKVTAYLPTSPEIHLKKAMAYGYSDVFEIKPCFRRGEFSPHHTNEFLMLEWYRGFADLELVQDDLRALLEAVGAPCAPKVTTFKELFQRFLHFELSPQTTHEELSALCERSQIHPREDDSFNDLFHRLLIDFIEPKFIEMGPLIVHDFPPSMAALARLTSEGWADRFEFYWNGLEIANAFNEVTNPDEQVHRWQTEKDERLHLGTSEIPDDPQLIQALKRGLPPTGGIALGVERLFMACKGVKEIRSLKLFSDEDLF